MMAIPLVLAFFIFEGDNLIYEMMTYLWILAALIVSLALILFVTYRISLSKSKKTAA